MSHLDKDHAVTARSIGLKQLQVGRAAAEIAFIRGSIMELLAIDHARPASSWGANSPSSGRDAEDIAANRVSSFNSSLDKAQAVFERSCGAYGTSAAVVQSLRTSCSSN